jgi:hypothetical protein
MLTPYANPLEISFIRIFRISLGIWLGLKALSIDRARIIVAISFYVTLISIGTRLSAYISKVSR